MASHSFFRPDLRDGGVFQTCDCWCNGGRNKPGHKKYIKTESGRLYSYPYYSLPYNVTTVMELARYGFIWCSDDTELGYLKCVYCSVEIKDFDSKTPILRQHIQKNPFCQFNDTWFTDNVSMIHFDYKIKPDGPRLVNGKEKFRSWDYDFRIEPNPNPATELERYHSFPEKWEYVMWKADLARYGFKYVGPKDCVQCVHCYITVQNWQEGDLAGIVHYNSNMHCPIFTKS